MKVVEVEKTIKEVTGYTADDGTFFKDKEECEKYEQTAEAVISARFAKLIKAKFSHDAILNAPYRFMMVYDDAYYAVIRMENEDDLKAANMYLNICKYDAEYNGVLGVNEFTKDMIGQDVIVMVQDYEYDNRCWIFGTLDELINNYRKAFQFAMLDKDKRDEIVKNMKDERGIS